MSKLLLSAALGLATAAGALWLASSAWQAAAVQARLASVAAPYAGEDTETPCYYSSYQDAAEAGRVSVREGTATGYSVEEISPDWFKLSVCH